MAQGQFNVPIANDHDVVSIGSAQGTTCFVLVDQHPAAAVTSVGSGITGMTGAAGGVRVTDIVISSSDTAADNMLLYTGKPLTTNGVNGITSLVVTGQNTITRSGGTGDFRVDGWRAGMKVMPFAPRIGAPNSSDGIVGIITSVTQTTLVVNGTPFTNETFATSTQLFKVGRRSNTNIPIGAGNSTSVNNVRVLGNVAQDQSNDLNGISLGATNILIVGLASSETGALPDNVDVTAYYGVL